MKVSIIGATGKAGSLITKEAIGRDYEVTAIVKPGTSARVPEGCAILEKNLFDLETEDLRPFDVVINAFGSKPGEAYQHIEATKHLIDIMTPIPDTRLMVVGGAGSLYQDEGKTRLVMDSIPEQWRAVPEAMSVAFRMLKESRLNWTYFSPAANFDPKGKRLGHVMLGTDYRILNADGQSYISSIDYAIAMVDEIANRQFVGKRFTAVSDTSYSALTDRMAFDISKEPFIRMGGYIGIFTQARGFFRGGNNYGTGRLYIGTRRGGASQRKTNELVRIAPAYKGKKIAYAIHTSPTELVLQTAVGKITCCFPEPNLLYIKGDGGLSLQIDKDMEIHEIMKKRAGKAWEGVFRWTCSCIFNPLVGDLEMDAPWDWEKLTTPLVHGEVLPDEKGNFLLAVDESEPAGFIRDEYPTYDAGLKNVKSDWEQFLEKIPKFISPLDDRREEAAYVLWSHVVGPAGKIKRPLMYMTGYGCASSWQMCQNAVALHHNLDLAVELMLNPFDEASPEGQLADFYDDMRGLYQLTKPPLQGWALKWIMKYHDLKQEVSWEKLEQLYQGCAKWADWHMTYRDDDHDGIPQYEHGDESGGDDCTVFQQYPIMETPDLCAYLGLLFEALGDLAGMLDKPEMEQAAWYEKSKTIIRKMIDAFWNGERFVAWIHGTREVIANDSSLYYYPIVLGKRLPQEIIDKMAEDLSVENSFLTPYGFTTEKMTSDNFSTDGMAKGMIIPPTNLLLITGLFDAGKTELARKAAMRYCRGMRDGGLTMVVSPFNGARGGLFNGSWPSCAYIALAELCGM